MRIYLAGPFFNPEQIERIERIRDLLRELGHKVYSPKDECLFVPHETKPIEVLQKNIDAIDDSHVCVCVTDGKDVGTMWEAGYCYAQHVDLVYFWETGKPGQKFNLMLAASGHVARTEEGLKKALLSLDNEEYFVEELNVEDIE